MHAAVIALFALVAVASAQFAPAAQQQFVRPPVRILGHQEIRDDFGQYSYSYATEDGAAFSDRGSLRQGPQGLYLVKEGSHEFTAPDGMRYKLTYVADETGYHPSAAHLPVAPVAPVA